MEDIKIEPKDHHRQHEFCTTRKAYRQGREFKAVKVYTVNDESVHLLVQNVPSINLSKELKQLCQKIGGQYDFLKQLPDYPPMEQFTHTFHLKYQTLKQSKGAKKRLDNRSFYGSVLHVCYAPELETIGETRHKLEQRQHFIQSFSQSQSQQPSTSKSFTDAEES